MPGGYIEGGEMNDPPRAFGAPDGPPGGWPDDSRRPATAWSSMTGICRQVPIRPASKPRAVVPYVVLLGFSAVTALNTVRSAALSGIGPLQAGLGFVALLLAVAGITGITMRARAPSRATYDGQLIARWRVRAEENIWTWYVAIDDGEQARAYRAPWLAGHIELGDLVRVTWNPRSRRLVSLAALQSPGQGRPSSARSS
jgi:hypothetical protein